MEVLIPKIEFVDPDKLRYDGDNPNKMTERQREALKNSITRWGFLIPVITNKDLIVADGQQRSDVARGLGIERIPVMRLPVDDVDRRLLRQILNKLKGVHQFELDAYEYSVIVDKGEQAELQALIGLSDLMLQKYLDHLNAPNSAELAGKPLMTTCPKCSNKFEVVI